MRKVQQDKVVCQVVYGGTLGERQGINLPGTNVSIPSLTEKDEADLEFGLKSGVDVVALSFVRTAEDIARVQRKMDELGRKAPIVAKLEKPQAIENLDAILQSAAGVMVARGDLGVELAPEKVPIIQKQVIRRAFEFRRPVITATQMLESMVSNPRPTRAEASDVANAILDGTDAVMLSAETAMGEYPQLAVHAMTRIILEIERRPIPQAAKVLARRESDAAVTTEDAIAAATSAAANSLDAPVVMVFTQSGFSARIVSAHRPGVPIVAITDVERTYRQLALVWGVYPELVSTAATYEEMFERGSVAVKEAGFAKPGDRVLVTAGVPFDVPGTTNLLRVEHV